MVKFYEVTFEYGITVPIKGTRKPTIQEAAAFCNITDKGAVVAVNEISAEKLLQNYHCNGIDSWPVFGDGEDENDEEYNKAVAEIGALLGKLFVARDELENEVEKSDLLGVALVIPQFGEAHFVDGFDGFEPLSETHKRAEEWVNLVNRFTSELDGQTRAVITNFNQNALRVALQYAVAFLGNEPQTTVLL